MSAAARVAAAARAVRSAPGLALAVVAIHLVLALWVGSSVRAAVGASLGRHAVVADGRLPANVLELFFSHPGVPAGAGRLLTGSTVLSLLLWTVLAAAIIRRLRSPAPAAVLAAAAVRHLPGVAVVTLWHLVPRAALLAIAGAATAKLLGAGAWGLAGLLLTFGVLGYCTCALDLARCDVVLHGAPRFHFRTALGGYSRAARRPDVLAPSLLLSLGQWACVAGVVAAAVSGLGSGHAAWLARGLAVLGILLGLTRLGVAVQARP